MYQTEENLYFRQSNVTFWKTCLNLEYEGIPSRRETSQFTLHAYVLFVFCNMIAIINYLNAKHYIKLGNTIYSL